MICPTKSDLRVILYVHVDSQRVLARERITRKQNHVFLGFCILRSLRWVTFIQQGCVSADMCCLRLFRNTQIDAQELCLECWGIGLARFS